ncbi:hypothetical protein AVEN_4998-1, partial [Araneus ventricosus]
WQTRDSRRRKVPYKCEARDFPSTGFLLTTEDVTGDIMRGMIREGSVGSLNRSSVSTRLWSA